MLDSVESVRMGVMNNELCGAAMKMIETEVKRREGALTNDDVRRPSLFDDPTAIMSSIVNADDSELNVCHRDGCSNLVPDKKTGRAAGAPITVRRGAGTSRSAATTA